ncbi:MAG: hypothetical protein LBH41_02485 [Rickettsiales bacterium]|jgi:16S rRNA processing protein RimM|nr:hypothetical protein [Rickettsiales bacterium]
MIIPVAKIVGVHGIKGAVKIQVFLERPKAVLDMPLSFADGRKVKLGFQGSGNTADRIVAYVEGVADRNAAESLKGLELFAPREYLAGPGEALLDELVGFGVSGGGRVVGRANHGAGDMLEIDTGSAKSALVLMQHVSTIDREAKTIGIDRDFLIQS